MKGDRISSFLGLLFALYILKESFSLGIGEIHQPGPGFFPIVGGIIVLIFSATLFLGTFLAQSSTEVSKSHEEKKNQLPAVYTVAGLIVYTSILEYAGFILSTFALVVLLLNLFDNRRWWEGLLIAGIISLAYYFLFTLLLKSALPKGLLELLL